MSATQFYAYNTISGYKSGHSIIISPQHSTISARG